MPLRYFNCPAGKVEVRDCLGRCPNSEGRCFPLPFLRKVSFGRTFNGVPSTTQLINGTRLAYLELTEDYAVDPQERTFAVLGTRVHDRLASIAEILGKISEKKLKGEVTGILDLLVEDENKPSFFILWDYKVSGSYKVAKSLGLVERKILDPKGAVYQSNGKDYKKGDPKLVSVFEKKPDAVDMLEWELQLNNYRVKLEELSFPISEMRIQAIVRDGGTFIAKRRGIELNSYNIPVKRLDDSFVKDYFGRKRRALLEALKKKELPPMCNKAENWNGRRCIGFCSVVEYCREGKLMWGRK